MRFVASAKQAFTANPHLLQVVQQSRSFSSSISTLFDLSSLPETDHVARGLQINGFPQSNGIASPHPLSAGSLPAHQSIHSSPQSPVSFSPDQISALKNRISALKALQKGHPIPEHLRNALLPQNHASTINNLEKAIQGPDTPSRQGQRCHANPFSAQRG